MWTLAVCKRSCGRSCLVLFIIHQMNLVLFIIDQMNPVDSGVKFKFCTPICLPPRSLLGQFWYSRMLDPYESLTGQCGGFFCEFLADHFMIF